MTEAPTVSVLMPAYNAADFLAEAIGSLLAQDFGDFELIVVDDGSTDATPEILAGLSDPRLVRLTERKNRGYVPALNRAWEIARGRYLARQDADDVSDPERLGAQVAFLDSHPEVALLGTAYRTLSLAGETLATFQPPTGDTEIRWHMLFQNAFVHSSVMLRRQALEKRGLRYEADYVPAEDYRLWSRLLERERGANLSRPLVAHRRHPEQISRRESDVQRDHADRVSRENLQRIGVDFDDDELRTVRAWALGAPWPPTRRQMATLASLRSVLEGLAVHTSDRRGVARIRRRWVRHTTGHLPVKRLGAAWASGLLPALLRTAPVTALAALAHRAPRRLARWLRAPTARSSSTRRAPTDRPSPER